MGSPAAERTEVAVAAGGGAATVAAAGWVAPVVAGRAVAQMVRVVTAAAVEALAALAQSMLLLMS